MRSPARVHFGKLAVSRMKTESNENTILQPSIFVSKQQQTSSLTSVVVLYASSQSCEVRDLSLETFARLVGRRIASLRARAP